MRKYSLSGLVPAGCPVGCRASATIQLHQQTPQHKRCCSRTALVGGHSVSVRDRSAAVLAHSGSTSSSLQPTSSRTSEGRGLWQQAVRWFQGLFASIVALLRGMAARLLGSKQATQSSSAAPSDADFQRELAGTRVETALRKAVSFKKMNDPPKVMNELAKAISENAICHSGSHTIRYSKEELQDLYQFYVQNAEMPAKRTELKQLRELLNLTERDTASIEASVLGSGDGWTI